MLVNDCVRRSTGLCRPTSESSSSLSRVGLPAGVLKGLAWLALLSSAADRIDALRPRPPLEEVHDSPDLVLRSLRLELVRSEVDLSGDSLPVEGLIEMAAANGQ